VQELQAPGAQAQICYLVDQVVLETVLVAAGFVIYFRSLKYKDF